MPVYEEKLISPLAIRFTQEHLSLTFSDGRVLEDVVPQVSTAKGAGPFDVLLKAPFPAIEIARWRACKVCQKHDNPVSSLNAEQGTEHWFSMDNRRLYVLQRAATALWPRRVGVAVDVLYAVPDELYETFDSSTCGLLASIGDSGFCTPGTTWNWLAGVTPAHGPTNMRQEKSALEQVRHDDMVGELALLVAASSGTPVSRALEADHNPWVLDGSEHNPQVSLAPSVTTLGCKSDSHASENDGAGQVQPRDAEPQRRSSSGVTQALEGTWRGTQHETYTVVFQKAGKLQVIGSVTRRREGVSKSFSITYDRGSGNVSWGANNRFSLVMSEVVEKPKSARWYTTKDSKLAFEWTKTDLPPEKFSSKANPAAMKASAAMEQSESEFKKSGRRPVHRGRHWKPAESQG